jgi:peptide/nickel transport system permease protein
VGTYVLRRLAQAVPVLLLSSVAIFLLLRLIPGDPAYVILGSDARPEQIQAVREDLRLDDPLPVQYVVWLGRVLQGDLGYSYRNKYPATELIAGKLPATLQLTIGGFTVALMLAIPMGVAAAVWPYSWLARLVAWYAGLGIAVPSFWLGILLSLFVGLHLKWLPPSGYAPLWPDPLTGLKYMILPSLTLGLGISAVLSRYLRASLLEVLNHDYVRTARAKGLGERLVIGRHAVRNALIPVVTILGLQIGAFMGGAVITEAVFDWPGLGRAFWNAVGNRDYNVVQAIVLFVVLSFILVNLMTDLVCAYLDPRIRIK